MGRSRAISALTALFSGLGSSGAVKRVNAFCTGFDFNEDSRRYHARIVIGLERRKTARMFHDKNEAFAYGKRLARRLRGAG